ncbi:MAG: hypothetical protein JF588_23800 [Caulobacterales bacterium]|nr:hypothetical protein [Caulobacterales bacterium]
MESPPTVEPRRRAPLILIGAVAALVAGLAIATLLLTSGRGEHRPPPASQAGLVIDSTSPDAGKIDPAKPLRCFVQGQYVGDLSLTDCAKRNGVATDALDVGLDQSGALAASDQAGEAITPLPPQEAAPVAGSEAAPAPEAAEGAQPVGTPGACWRYGGGRWRRTPGEIDLNACVQQLFAGHCEKPGAALYGRFGEQTLRLVTGKVEISDDNKSFRTLVSQPSDCSLPPVQ